MKSKTLSILIDRPAGEVWEFTTNPSNTARWLDFIEEERSSSRPAHLGATYWNKRFDGSENGYEVTAWEPSSRFQLASLTSSLVVEYAYRQVASDRCELRYSERVEEGELSELFTQEQLDRLKTIMENDHH